MPINKTLLINNFNSVRANCENDYNKSFQSIIKLIHDKSSEGNKDHFTCEIDSLLLVMEEIKNNDSLVYVESKKYVRDYIIKKIKSNIIKKCRTWMRDLCRSELDKKCFNYEIDYSKKCLFPPPSKNFNKLMTDIYHVIVACLSDCPESILITRKMKYIVNYACVFNMINL